MSPPQGSAQQVTSLEGLPPKEKALVRQANKLHEERRQAKALKIVDGILKKYPNCCEVLALKALILHNVPGRRKEAYSAVRQALRVDTKSFVAWHVLGLLHRMDNQTHECIKPFVVAVRLAPDHHTLLRDLSLAYLQLQQFPRFTEVRLTILHLQPHYDLNWISAIFGQRMSGMPLEAAANWLGFMRFNQVSTDRARQPYERNHAWLFYVDCLEAGGQYSEAARVLEKGLEEGNILDEFEARERLGRYYLKLRQPRFASAHFLKLCQLIPENIDYILAYLMCQPECGKILPNPYDGGSKYPKIVYPKVVVEKGIDGGRGWCGVPFEALNPKKRPNIIGMDATGREFDSNIGSRTPVTHNGSFWNYLYLMDPEASDEDIRSLRAATEGLIEVLGSATDSLVLAEAPFIPAGPKFKSFIKKFLKDRKFSCGMGLLSIIRDLMRHNDKHGDIVASAVDLGADLKEDDAKEFSCICRAIPVVSALMRNLPKKALKIIEEGIRITPQSSMLRMLRAECLAAVGNFKDASACLEKLRQEDPADRYINTKTTETLMRAGQVREGLTTSRSFVRQSELKQGGELQDSQMNQMELDMSRAAETAGDWGQAAARYNRIIWRFGTLNFATQDFQWYCVRRWSLLQLKDLLAANEMLIGHRYCRVAVHRLVRLYLLKADGLIAPEPFKPGALDVALPKRSDTSDVPSPSVCPDYDFADVSDCQEEALKLLSAYNAVEERDIVLHQLQITIMMREDISPAPWVLLKSLSKTAYLLGNNHLHPNMVVCLALVMGRQEKLWLDDENFVGCLYGFSRRVGIVPADFSQCSFTWKVFSLCCEEIIEKYLETARSYYGINDLLDDFLLLNALTLTFSNGNKHILLAESRCINTMEHLLAEECLFNTPLENERVFEIIADAVARNSLINAEVKKMLKACYDRSCGDEVQQMSQSIIDQFFEISTA